MQPRDTKLRFDGFEVDLSAESLTRSGRRVRLQRQPLLLLGALARRRGEVLSREELRSEVWGEGTFVDFDQSLNYCIRQIRLALDDDAARPRYIETLPKQGYRFLIPVEIDSPTVPQDITDTLPVEAREAERNRPRPVFLLGALLGAVAGLSIWGVIAGRSSSIPYPLRITKVTKLTSYPGDEREPAISPDGSLVAFSWSGPDNNNYDIYVAQAGGQPPLRLTHDPAPDSFPAWSPDGRQIAFIRREGGRAEIILVPPLGGPERLLHRFSRTGADLDFTQHPVLSWSRDDKLIIFSGQSDAGGKYQLFSLSVEAGDIHPITFPPGEINGDSSPAISGNGKSLAFARYLAVRNGKIMIQPLGPEMTPQGEPAEIPNSGLGVRSPVWLEDGKQLLFADAAQIFQWDRNRGTISIYASEGVLGGMSVGPRKEGIRQAVVATENHDIDIWSIRLDPKGLKASGPPEVFLRSTQSDNHPDFSPDGQHIVFVSSRSGTPEIWVSDVNGGNLRQLTHLGAHVLSYPKWSPDGTRIAFHARIPDVAEVYVVALSGGVPRQITHKSPGLALATWSNDGKIPVWVNLGRRNRRNLSLPRRRWTDGAPLDRRFSSRDP
jgi:Tol biopolymer transport system component/DNA-binding winged helix-turn-helix (wHTH) protein